jgi:membrane protein implicated in regulation of membrane protease activity
VFLSIFKIDILRPIVFGLWLYNFLIQFGNQMITLIATIIVGVLIIAVEVIYFKAESKKIRTAVNEVTASNNLKEKKGVVKANINGNSYLGITTENEEILIYCEDKLINGDKFIITGVDGFHILASKLNE